MAVTGSVVTSSSGTAKRAARRLIAARPAPLAPVTARSPRLMMAAFSKPMRASVLPSRSMWSSSTLVMTATPPSHVLVASRRPPRPTSTTATSTAWRANQAKAAAVSNSNSVGGPSDAGTWSAARSTSPSSSARSSDAMGRPSTTMRSR